MSGSPLITGVSAEALGAITTPLASHHLSAVSHPCRSTSHHISSHLIVSRGAAHHTNASCHVSRRMSGGDEIGSRNTDRGEGSAGGMLGEERFSKCVVRRVERCSKHVGKRSEGGIILRRELALPSQCDTN